MKPGDLYRHAKTGHIYQIIDVARHTETGEILVIYRRREKAGTWARPAEKFNGQVVVRGRTTRRFLPFKLNAPLPCNWKGSCEDGCTCP
jgi:hypothetical protein